MEWENSLFSRTKKQRLCHICPLPTMGHFSHLPTVCSTQTCWPRILCTFPSAFAEVTASLENAPFFPLWILAHLTKAMSKDALSKGFLLCFTEQIFPKFLPGAGLRYKKGVCDEQKSQPLCQDERTGLVVGRGPPEIRAPPSLPDYGAAAQACLMLPGYRKQPGAETGLKVGRSRLNFSYATD